MQPTLTVSDRRAHTRRQWRRRLSVPVVATAVLALSLGTAGASARSGGGGGGGGETVKVGIIVPITGATTANPDTADAFEAAIEAFNKRGGVGVNGLDMEPVICDSRGDANAEVDCAREMEEEGVAATINDLAFNNPAGVVEVMEAAGIARIGLVPTNISEFQSTVSYPISAGPIAAYIGVALGFADAGHETVTLVRTDAPTGATFRGFVEPLFEAAGVEIVGDIALATGATDYAPYVSEIQRTEADAVLFSVGDEAATQLIAAMSQLNFDIPMGGAPGTFELETLLKHKKITQGALLSESFPYPTKNNTKEFPGLKQYFRDMKASGVESLNSKNLNASSFNPWVGVLAFVQVTEGLEEITNETVIEALESAQDVDLLGLTPPWTPSTPGFSVFESSSNHFVFISRFNGKNVVSKDDPIDITQYTG